MHPFRSLLAAGALHWATTMGALQYKGADWSSALVMEREGIVYKSTDFVDTPIETTLKANGINIVRQRVWTAAGDYDLDYNIKLAKRAKAAGLAVHINLHFSDSWADPGKQTIPEGWPGDLAGLLDKIYSYTLDVCNKLQAAGIQPAIIDLGNEIAVGLLYPVGRGGSENWNNTAALLRSASDAVRASTLNPKPKINIHLNAVSDRGTQDYFWGNILKVDPAFTDCFESWSASHYPFYGPQSTLANLDSTLKYMTTELLPGKEFMVSEMAWPWSCNQGGNFEFPPDQRPRIPFNATGQMTWVKEVAASVAAAGGKGVEYWEIGWVKNAGLGFTGCEDAIMFWYEGGARPSIKVFSEI